jgi:hypothetical protein
VARSNHSKTEKRPEKIIPWRRHHRHLDAAVRKQKSPCGHVDEDVDANVVALIFNGAAMEKMIPPFPFTVARDEEKEEIKLQYQIIWHGETLTLMTLGKLIKNNGSPLPSAPGEMPEEKGGGPAVMNGGSCGGGSARAQPPKVEAQTLGKYYNQVYYTCAHM